MQWRILVTLGLSAAARAEYVWPSPQYDFFEDKIAIHSGYIRFGFSDLVVPCSFGFTRPGIQNSAEWIRSAFHDSITHDVSTGIGGLDASLIFELDRPENVGAAFNNTFQAMEEFVSIRSSAADMLALSVVAASAACGGPRIPLRIGRVDAQEAGVAGVPKPEDSLEKSRDAFKKAGFNDEDMIAMVACGHTMGRVHSVDFPELVSGAPTEDNIANFDKTTAAFDNAVVTEYLSNSTANPLIIGKNETMNSDKRIFAADGNATMLKLADQATFQSKCGELFTRMIDTVPSTVTLSKPVELVDVKPYISTLELQNNGSILFSGRVRVRTSSVTGRDSEDLSITLLTTDRNGKVGNIATTRARLAGGQSFGFHDEVFTWFEFSTSLPIDSPIRSFNIQMATPSIGNATILDNGGYGYPVNTDLLYQEASSCLGLDGNNGNLTVVAAIRKGQLPSPNAPKLHLVRKISRPGVVLSKLSPDVIDFKSTGVERGGYTYFRASTNLAAESWATTFDIVLGDVVKVVWLKTNNIVGKECENFA